MIVYTNKCTSLQSFPLYRQIAMSQRSKDPLSLYLQTKRYFFCLRWHEATMQIEAVNKNELTKCYRGELKGQEKTLKDLYEFLEIHSYKQSLSDNRVDELSLIITIIDMTDEGKGYACRIIFNDTIKEVKVQPCIVSQTYFLTKKIEALQFEKKNDRQMMASFGNELTKKLEEKDQDIKKTLTEQLQGVLSAFTNRFKDQLESREKRKKPDEDQSLEGLDKKRIEKKLKKKIMKELKERKREKRHRRSEKKKKRKARRREKKRLQALLMEQTQPHEAQPNLIEIPEENPQIGPLDNLQNFPFHNQDPNNFLNVDEVQIDAIAPANSGQLEKKKKKQKHKHKHKHERAEKEAMVVQPAVTSLDSMGKLRNRGGDLFIPSRTERPIEVIDDTREKKEKKSKEKKKKEKKQEKDVQAIEETAEKQYLKRLQQIRKTGGIAEVRVARANRLKPVLALPKQPLNEVDEFNPKYNGEPRYKPFVGLNQYQPLRPGEIFVNRMEQVRGECKKISAIFREEIPSFKHFEVNGSVIRKISGLNYQQMVFDYCVPQSGRHVTTMRIIESKRMYIWFGVVDIREKDREESFNKKNCITFSFRTGHVATSNKWSRNKVGRMEVGHSIRMEIDMDKNSIVWYISDGRNSIAPIPKLMKKLNLAPYFQIMDVGDEICFQE